MHRGYWIPTSLGCLRITNMFGLFSQLPSKGVEDTFASLGGEGVLLIDVRETEEYKAGHAQGAVSQPLSELINATAEALKNHKEVYVICRSGGRSSQAVVFLKKCGVNAINVIGGTMAWVEKGLPMEK